MPSSFDQIDRADLQEITLARSNTESPATIHRVEEQLDYIVDLLASEQAVALPSTPLIERLSGQTPSEVEPGSRSSQRIDLSVLVATKNNAEQLPRFFEQLSAVCRRLNISTEIIVVDRGSRDASVEIARSHGASVLLMPGVSWSDATERAVAAASGEFLLTAEADGKCSMEIVEAFWKKLQQGVDLVVGAARVDSTTCDTPRDAIRTCMRQCGKQAKAWLASLMFDTRVSDVGSRLRAFRSDVRKFCKGRLSGTSWSTEMTLRCAQWKCHIEEVGFGYDASENQGTAVASGRRSEYQNLYRSMASGLRLFFRISPRWSLLVPGMALGSMGALGFVGLGLQSRWGDSPSDYQLLFGSTLSAVLSVQMLSSAVIAKAIAIRSGWLPKDSRIDQFRKVASLPRMMSASVLMFVLGMLLMSLPLSFPPASSSNFRHFAAPIFSFVAGMGMTAMAYQVMAFSFLWQWVNRRDSIRSN